MSAFCGMDTAQARDHAQRLRTASGAVEDLRSRLDPAIRSATWTGPDAEEFRRRWTELSSGPLGTAVQNLAVHGDRLLGQADQQDVTSDADGTEHGPPGNPSTLPAADAGDSHLGYLRDDDPWLPDWLEGPLENGMAHLAGTASDLIGWGVDAGIDALEGGLGLFGVNTDGIAQFQRDAGHLGGVLEDWATGRRVPTVAELGASSLLAAGSGLIGLYEAATGTDTPLLDDRPGGIVDGITTSTEPARSPQTLQDLVLENNGLRRRGEEAVAAGNIGIQEVRSADGAEPVYIVQVPPTEGEAITDVPGAYGEQGNSRDWGSNLRLVAGQHPAAMDDVQAAMEAAGVPPGARVMLVGHSQGGIIANQLAADPGFNNASGAPGTYDITHTFSVGSPVQTVVPAQSTTESVNVHHGFGLGPGGVSGDLIPRLDLDGLQVDGGTLGAPNRHEVSLPGYPVPSLDPVRILESNHDSVGLNGEADAGYAGSVADATATDPTLSALQRDLTGVYIGQGTYVARSTVVSVGRGEP
ncbi:hypothetical protein [Brachybacterium hainanense]|uniref:Alpha/beta hydrolase n=1 Tax=Brachybacterium hainanense TaxID=1541174 RepID=A0ABV6RGQ8_9MICO